MLFAVMALVAAVPAVAATKTVKIGDDWFISKASNGGTVTVKKGTVVKWRNTGESRHTVTVKKGPVKFSKTMIAPGSTVKKRMRKRGTYRLICVYHSGQKMKLVVK